MKAPKAPTESAAQIAAREAEEARIAVAEGKAKAVELTSLGRDVRRRTTAVRRAFGARTALNSPVGGLAGMAGVGATSLNTGAGGFMDGGGGSGGFGGGYGGERGLRDFF